MERLRCSQPIWVRMCLQFRKSLIAVHCGHTRGTGWIAAIGDGFVVATANHVIKEAGSNNQPIRLHHTDSDTWIDFELTPDNLVRNGKLDLAVFSVPSSSPGPSLRLMLKHHESNRNLRYIYKPHLGVEVGWLGYSEGLFQVFGKSTCTFFRGYVSAVGEWEGETLFCLAGNVNRGLSGGPVFDETGTVIGVVLANVGCVPDPTKSTVADWQNDTTDTSVEPELPISNFGLITPIWHVVDALELLGIMTVEDY